MAINWAKIIEKLGSLSDLCITSYHFRTLPIWMLAKEPKWPKSNLIKHSKKEADFLHIMNTCYIPMLCWFHRYLINLITNQWFHTIHNFLAMPIHIILWFGYPWFITCHKYLQLSLIIGKGPFINYVYKQGGRMD